MASLITALQMAIRAQDDEFVKGILGSETLSDDEVYAAVSAMDEGECSRFFDVLVVLILREPINNKAQRWLAAISKRGCAAAADSATGQALATLTAFESVLRERLVSLQPLVAQTLENSIARVQQHAFREARDELARATQDSEPLLKYTVKH